MDKVLVIDDDSRMRKQVVDVLVTEGFTVVEARHGREGVELAVQHRPALVVCDITMPEMNGHRVLQKIRENPAIHDVPFIFLTGWDDPADQRTGMNLGADDYLLKPVNPDDLIAAVRARLRRRKQIGGSKAPMVADATPQALTKALGLTAREAEILSWVVQGKTNPEIGVILGIQLTTVKKHLESIFTKLGVENRTAAVTLALEKLIV